MPLTRNVDVWKVMDDEGTIHSESGPDAEGNMHEAFQDMVDGKEDSEWWYEWTGDLMLVHLIRMIRISR